MHLPAELVIPAESYDFGELKIDKQDPKGPISSTLCDL